MHKRILVPVVGGLFLLTILGCDSSSPQPPKTPESMRELPKQGPVAAGASGGAKGGTGIVPEKKNTTD
jgi:hypothetical protein